METISRIISPEEDGSTVRHILKAKLHFSSHAISRLTRTIMQLAIFEILYLDDVPTGVAIAEAIRIVKLYDGNEAGSFANGILGSFARSLTSEVEV